MVHETLFLKCTARDVNMCDHNDSNILWTIDIKCEMVFPGGSVGKIHLLSQNTMIATKFIMIL